MLTFNLKKEWYDKIKAGGKTVEYREVKPYWTIRIATAMSECYPNFGKPYSLYMTNLLSKVGNGIGFELGDCIFRLGYTKIGELKAHIEYIDVINGKDTDLKIDKPVYAIHFKLIGE